MSDTTPTPPRPAGATVAAALLAALSVVQAAVLVVDLVPGIVETVTAPAVDGMTALVHWLVAGFLAGVLGAGLAVLAIGPYAAWRILGRARWALVEGLVAAVIGGASAAILIGVRQDGAFEVSAALVAILAGYGAVIGLLLGAREWLPAPGWPLSPDDAPWWLRGGGPL